MRRTVVNHQVYYKLLASRSHKASLFFLSLDYSGIISSVIYYLKAILF